MFYVRAQSFVDVSKTQFYTSLPKAKNRLSFSKHASRTNLKAKFNYVYQSQGNEILLSTATRDERDIKI